MRVVIKFSTPGGLDFLATEDFQFNKYGSPFGTRIAQRLPESKMWIPDTFSDDCHYMNLPEAEHYFADEEEALHWVRTGEMPVEREERERLLEILDYGAEHASDFEVLFTA